MENGCEEVIIDQDDFVRKAIADFESPLIGYAVGFLHDVERARDVVQDTFIKAYRKLESFQHQSSFSTWLYRIAVNTALDFLKRAGRNPVQSVEDPEQLGGQGTGQRPQALGAPEAGLESEEIAELTHEVLDTLPEIFRTVLILREFEEMAYQDIADMLGISIGTVESRLFRARARFKAAFLRMHPEYIAR